MAQSTAVAVSAPGKVLLAGGYLVLDRKYTGLVFGLDARIHVHVAPVRTSPGVVLSEIIVRSPQFVNAAWEYGYRLSPADGGIQVTELRADADIKLKRNVFIETALAFTLSYIFSISPVLIPSATITILADNDYYSTTGANVSTSERFHDFGIPLEKANKTGLGSSAALVTAFTAALLRYYLPQHVFSLDDKRDLRKLHNLAQTAHCAAQGKVGSGFDVASAVYGSCVYRRFSPSILAGCGEPGTKGFAHRLRDLIDESGLDGTWDTEVTKDSVKVPKGLRLVMCDVTGGSQTPGMVKTVLKWRQTLGQPAEESWEKLQVTNSALAAEFVALANRSDHDYTKLRDCILNIRKLIRQMSEASGVPIEPSEQTQLIDSCSEVEGVIGGVVPGAGGYDAIALLIEDRTEVMEKLSAVLQHWNPSADDRNLSTSKVRLLSVREEMDGIRAEDACAYEKWVS